MVLVSFLVGFTNFLDPLGGLSFQDSKISGEIEPVLRHYTIGRSLSFNKPRDILQVFFRVDVGVM